MLSIAEVGYGLLQLMLFAANCLAALGVVLTCFASPGYIQPIMSITVSCVAAIAIGILGIWAFRNPVCLAFLPLLTISTGTIVGILSVWKESQGSWIVLLGNIQMLEYPEVLFRFFTALVTIGVLAVFCTSYLIARGLLLFALSGPGLLLLYLARTVVTAHWPAAEIWKVHGVLLGGNLTMVIVWAILLNKSFVLEKVHDALGRRVVSRVLDRGNPMSINMILRLIDGWIDPLRRVERMVQDLGEAKTLNARQTTLSKFLETLKERTYILPLRCRQKLETLASSKPEALIVIAEDDFLCRRPVNGFVRLAQMMDELAAETTWLIDIAFAAWNRYRTFADSEVQQALWTQVKTQQSDSKSALGALVMIALEQGLSPEIVNAFEVMDSNATLLLICNDVYNGKMQEVWPHIIGRLPEIPEMVVRSKLLPKLRDVALKSEISQQQWFFKQDKRPQLLEVMESPLTSIYGGRITCWTFFEETGVRGRRPLAFAVTGHGPGPVCSRVSAILNDMANERNCPSDLLLAGMSFFDLTANPPPSPSRVVWNQDELRRRVRDLAKRLGVEEVLLQVKELKTFLAAFAGQVLQPTIHRARESLQQVEAEMGFVLNKDIDERERKAALEVFNNREKPSAGESIPSIPLLIEYRHYGKPLRIKLPLLFLGIEDYEHVVSEYRRSVREEMSKEWERRRRKYEEWSQHFASMFNHLHMKLARGDLAALSSQVIYIHFRIDLETATEIRLDPPKPETELEYLKKLPLWLVNQLAYWAWVNYKIETLPEEHEFRPHWERTCLVDAFLRGWPLPTEDKKLNAVREEWQKNWRPLALIALDLALREYGLTLSDIAVENTVFRVVGEDDDYLTLGLLHIWDPYYDPPPRSKEGVTLFAPAFGRRQRHFTTARTAQKQATHAMKRLLASTPILPSDLQMALSLDSGEAIDFLLRQLCQPFVKNTLESDIKRVMKEASKRIDPLVSFRLKEKLGKSSTLHDLLALAQECGWAGRKKGAVPDFLAWEIYLVGEAVRNVVKNLQREQIQRIPPSVILPQDFTWRSQLQLPPGIEAECVHRMSEFTPWQFVAELIHQGQCAETVKAILKSLGFADVIARLHDSYALLTSKDQEYAKRCMYTDGHPPISHQRKIQSAPDCLSGWDRVCYDIAKGDTALGFAWALREGTTFTDRDILAELFKTAKEFPISETFEDLILRRNELVTTLENFQKRGDAVSLHLAAASVRQTLMEVLDIAESAYQRAALLDSKYGCGWLRLARLKWLTAHYRKALSIIVGSSPKADLQACQLPFDIAVRAAGGNLSFTEIASGAWNGSRSGAITVSHSEKGDLVLEFRAGTVMIGKCVVSGLSETDMNLLGEFFQKYQPDMFQSAGSDTFEEWMRLIQVPNVGRRAVIADAVQGETEFALLATCVYLGVPDVLGLAPGSSAIEPRPSQWLKENVVSSLNWRS